MASVLAGRLGAAPLWRVATGHFSAEDRERAAAAIEAVGLMPQSWRRADTLSGGQQQRVAIARALGDHHWYTIAVITHPTYALPQELCLSFDCFSRTETMGNGTSSGPPIEPVAIELGAIISLLAREAIIPLGVRRVDGKPVKWDNSSARVLRPVSSAPLPEAGINSDDLRAMVEGLAQGAPENAEAILAAAKLYHAALTLSGYDISTAYFSLVAAIECIAGHYLKDQVFEFDAVEKFKKSGAVIDQISPLIPDSELPRQLKEELLRGEHFIGQKFRAFIDEFLTADFWLPDKLYPDGYAMPAIEKDALKKHLRGIYDARSKFAHAGRPFPDYVANGVSDRVSTSVAANAGTAHAGNGIHTRLPLV